MTDYVDKLEKQIDRALDRITELEETKRKSSDEISYWTNQVAEWAAKCGERDARISKLEKEIETLKAKNIG
jgi:peptidoglycan hydrolase CwlO-like protein